MSKRINFILLLIFGISGCTNGLFISPQIPTGGINSRYSDENPSYSGDGRYLAFASERQGHRDIYLYDNQKRALVALPNLNHRNSSQDQPALSNNGRYIAYVSTERGKTDIFVYDRNSQRPQLLSANVRGSVRNPTITGNGSSVAFQTSQLGQWNIAIVERNLSND